MTGNQFLCANCEIIHEKTTAQKVKMCFEQNCADVWTGLKQHKGEIKDAILCDFGRNHSSWGKCFVVVQRDRNKAKHEQKTRYNRYKAMSDVLEDPSEPDSLCKQ